MRARRFRVATPQIISETLEGEAVVIDLDTGTYYSLDPVGTTVWDAVTGGATVEETVGRVRARFDGPLDVVQAGVLALLSDMEREGLLVTNNGADDSASGPSPSVPSTENDLLPFRPPSLSRYTDIQDLLLLDPIHEVEEGGWPGVKLPSGAQGTER